MRQQEQTRGFFRSHADDWQKKSAHRGSGYDLIGARNRAVLDTVDTAGPVERSLDVGCGTGQLVIELARRGIAARGNDFADEMIVKCEENKAAAGVQADFVGGSFFDADFDDDGYDMISALGFIEYLSPDEMTLFFERSFGMLRQGGLLVVGSRNRLFNAYSLNEFTTMESDLGTLSDLMREAMMLHASDSQAAALEALRSFERIDPQPASHPTTGIKVDTRVQYAPADLVYRLHQNGFRAQTIYPVHYHGLVPRLKMEHPQIHAELAQLIDDIGARDQRLLPFCSSFVLAARKAD